jgi:hypothetical protein
MTRRSSSARSPRGSRPPALADASAVWPLQAKRPLPTPAPEIQVDPATLPENIALTREIDQLAQSKDHPDGP